MRVPPLFSLGRMLLVLDRRGCRRPLGPLGPLLRSPWLLLVLVRVALGHRLPLAVGWLELLWPQGPLLRVVVARLLLLVGAPVGSEFCPPGSGTACLGCLDHELSLAAVLGLPCSHCCCGGGSAHGGTGVCMWACWHTGPARSGGWYVRVYPHWLVLGGIEYCSGVVGCSCGRCLWMWWRRRAAAGATGLCPGRRLVRSSPTGRCSSLLGQSFLLGSSAAAAAAAVAVLPVELVAHVRGCPRVSAPLGVLLAVLSHRGRRSAPGRRAAVSVPARPLVLRLARLPPPDSWSCSPGTAGALTRRVGWSHGVVWVHGLVSGSSCCWSVSSVFVCGCGGCVCSLLGLTVAACPRQQ